MARTFIIAVFLALIGLPGIANGPLPEPRSQKNSTSSLDLVQVTLVLPGKVKIAKTFTVMDEVENQGAGVAFPTKTYFYLSEDDKLDEKDVLVGGRRVPQLGSYQSHQTVTPVTLKPQITPGKYYFIAMADAPHDIEERYRDNNARAVKVTVEPADPPKK